MSDDMIRVAVNGYGVIGKRIADAVVVQDDMELIGVADVVSDWRIKVAVEKGYPVFDSTPDAAVYLVTIVIASGIRWTPHRCGAASSWAIGERLRGYVGV